MADGEQIEAKDESATKEPVEGKVPETHIDEEVPAGSVRVAEEESEEVGDGKRRVIISRTGEMVHFLQIAYNYRLDLKDSKETTLEVIPKLGKGVVVIDVIHAPSGFGIELSVSPFTETRDGKIVNEDEIYQVAVTPGTDVAAAGLVVGALCNFLDNYLADEISLPDNVLATWDLGTINEALLKSVDEWQTSQLDPGAPDPDEIMPNS